MTKLSFKQHYLLVVLSLSIVLLFLSYVTNKDKLFNNQKIRRESGVFVKGTAPLNKTWILYQLKPFLSVYDNRPGKSNEYGSKLMHQFALWCLIKHFKPKFVIESGIYQGLGTWIMRQAAPDAKLILLDPMDGTGSVYKDTHENTIYMTGHKFNDFNRINWFKIVKPEETFLFIDDHQFSIRRMQEALKFGFKHVVFDDNYWGVGDILTLKQILPLLNKDNIMFKKLSTKFSNINNVLVEAKTFLDKHVDTYWEFPQLWSCQAGVGECNRDPRSTNHLFNITDGETLLKQYGLTKLPPNKETEGYYNIAYVRLK